MDIFEFSKSPIYLMRDKSHPFDDWTPEEVDVPNDLRQIFNYYAWLYQLYMFFMLTWEHQGEEVASKVLEIQSSSVSKIMDSDLFNIGDGYNISDTMLKINLASSELMKKPIFEDMEGINTEMPLEYGLAKRFLLTNELSPMKFKEKDIDYGEIPILSLCLTQAKESALDYFEPHILKYKHETW